MADGLLSTGFVARPVSTILANFEAAQLAGISTGLNFNAPDPIAVVNGIVAAALADVWLVIAAVYNGRNPDGAMGDQLTSISLLTGTERQGAQKAIVPGCVVHVANGFSQAAGTMFASQANNPSVLFTNVQAVANTSGIAADETVDFQAVNAGLTGTIPIATLTVIASAIAGWTTINNPSAGVAGANAQGDSALRVARTSQLGAQGSATAMSIQAAVLRYMQISSFGEIPTFNGIATVLVAVAHNTLSCRVLYNDTLVTDANGVPRNSLEVIAYSPGSVAADDISLCALILSYKASGIATYSGNGTSKTIADTQGQTKTVFYTRPTEVPTNIAITVEWGLGVSPDTVAIQEAIALYVAGTSYAGVSVTGKVGAWYPGATAYRSAVIGAAFNVPGVVNVSACTLAGADGSGNVVPADVRHIITVNVITVS